jgi:hypothetical protein
LFVVHPRINPQSILKILDATFVGGIFITGRLARAGKARNDVFFTQQGKGRDPLLESRHVVIYY